MQKLFFDTRTLDQKARETFGLSEAVMVENAASALETEVQNIFADFTTSFSSFRFKQCVRKPFVLILTGGGNNGADGYALSRRIFGEDFGVTVCALKEPKTELCKNQAGMAKRLGVSIIAPLEFASYIEENGAPLVTVDCVFGSGFYGELPLAVQEIFEKVKLWNCATLSCDIPSGLSLGGTAASGTFCAQKTVSMGALKCALFSDEAKDVSLSVTCAPLGVSRLQKEDALLLEASDLRLPFRKRQNVHKGTFGHAAVVMGKKPGAALLCAQAALSFGAGLVTLVSNKTECLQKIPAHIMFSADFPQKTSAVALGMGLGETCENYFPYLLENPQVACVLDADSCLSGGIKEVLSFRSGQNAKTVITPHPKEFASLLSLCGFGKYNTGDVLKEKILLAKEFCKKYKNVVLVLKGANPLIVQKVAQNSDSDEDNVSVYVNPLGSAALAKAGSGDILSGLIAALLCQNYSALDAAIHSSLAHAMAGSSIQPNFSLTPQKIIKAVCSLGF